MLITSNLLQILPMRNQSINFNHFISVICPSNADYMSATSNTTRPLTLYERIWDLNTTVPIFLVVIVAPLLNFRSATFFTKFNSLGKLMSITLHVYSMYQSVVLVPLIDDLYLPNCLLYIYIFFLTGFLLN